MAKRKRVQLVQIEVGGVMVDAKECTKCGEVKALEEFSRNKRKAGGRDSWCKECERWYRLESRERIAEYNRKRWAANRDPAARRCKHVELVQVNVNGEMVTSKECTTCGEVKALEDFARKKRGLGGRASQCKACNAECWQLYYKENHERELERCRKYREDNHERVLEYVLQWRKDNPEKFREIEQRYRTRKRGLPSDMTNRRWEEIVREDFSNVCALTGETDGLHLEHFIPVAISHGGTYGGNVYPLLGELNGSKNNANPFEWIQRPDIRERIPAERWNALVSYLAEKNGLTVEDFRDFVYWCFDNPRTPEQAAKDTKRGITSLDLWRASKLRVASNE